MYMDHAVPSPISTSEEVAHNCTNVAVTVRKIIAKIVEKNISDIDPNRPLNDLGLSDVTRALLVDDLEYAFNIKISESNNPPTIQWLIDHVTDMIKKNNLSKND